MNWKEKLENRWGVKGWKQIGIILLVFALTGSSSVWVRKYLLVLLGIGPDTPALFRIPISVLTIFVAYQILLIAIGTLFGQFNFFWNFEINMYRRIFHLFSKPKSEITDKSES